MRLKTLTFGMGMVGLLMIILSIVRWFFIYYDPSQAVLGVGIGIIVLGFAYIHERLWKIASEIADQHKGLDGLNIWTREEFEKMNIQLNKFGGNK